MSERVRSVAVVGRDASLWLAAAALQRALGRTDVRVQAVELDSRLTQVDAYAAVPTLAAMHRLLGIDERLVLQVCKGVPMVAQRFSNWANNARPYMIAYDDEPGGSELPFSQYWTKGTLEGLRVGLEDFSLGAACARLNAVPVSGEEPAPLSASYGYQLDAPLYAELIKQFAIRLGVEIAPATVRDVVISGDRIERVNLTDGSELASDLYIDASGRQGLLLGQLAGAGFDDWSEWLPCNRMVTATAPRMAQLPAFAQISAFGGGWVGQFPLQDRTVVSAVYSSGAVSDDEAVKIAGVLARSSLRGEAVVSHLRPGMQRTPWIGNCVGIGEAAIAVDPVDAVELHVTHGCISHLMTLFPATAEAFPEADAYNRAIRSFGANLRDFQAAHYVLNRRFDDRLWDRVRDAHLPPELKGKIDLFSARSAVPLNDEESFHEQSWAALLVGCGVQPQDYDPRVDSIPAEVHVQRMQQRLRDVASLARQMPAVERFLALEQPSPALVGE